MPKAKKRKPPKRERPDRVKLPPAENRLLPVVLPAPVIPADLEPLEPRQDRFVREYLRDLNGTQACIRAGYAQSSASQQAALLMANPKVRAHLDFHVAYRNVALGVSADDLVRELHAIATANVEDFEVRDDGGVQVRDGAPPRSTAAVSAMEVTQFVTRNMKTGQEFREIKTKFRLWSKLEAARQLREHLGLPGAAPGALVDARKVTVHVHGPPVGPQLIPEVHAPVAAAKGSTAIVMRSTVGQNA